MAIPVGTILTGASIAGSIISGFGASRRQRRAAREAMRLAEINAIYDEMTQREEERRFRYQYEQERGRAVAAMAAGGITLAGTPTMQLENLDDIYAEEVDWLRRSGETRRRAIIQEGRTGAAQARIGASATEWATLSSALEGVGFIGRSQNWWQ